MRKLPQDLQDLQDIDLAELNLDPATYELMQRLLNCIEILVADLNEAQAEIQRLRDEIARLKGERGKPNISNSRSIHRTLKKVNRYPFLACPNYGMKYFDTSAGRIDGF